MPKMMLLPKLYCGEHCTNYRLSPAIIIHVMSSRSDLIFVRIPAVRRMSWITVAVCAGYRRTSVHARVENTAKSPYRSLWTGIILAQWSHVIVRCSHVYPTTSLREYDFSCVLEFGEKKRPFPLFGGGFCMRWTRFPMLNNFLPNRS